MVKRATQANETNSRSSQELSFGKKLQSGLTLSTFPDAISNWNYERVLNIKVVIGNFTHSSLDAVGILFEKLNQPGITSMSKLACKPLIKQVVC